MTRDQAIEKATSAIASRAALRGHGLVTVQDVVHLLVALGLLKFDEPKSSPGFSFCDACGRGAVNEEPKRRVHLVPVSEITQTTIRRPLRYTATIEESDLLDAINRLGYEVTKR